MAPEVGEADRRGRAVPWRSGETRHPAVAVAIALPGAVLLLALFGGWQHLVAQAEEVAGLIGR